MSLRFFCDQCVPLEISETLRHAGHNVSVVRNLLPIRSPDTNVIAKARELGVETVDEEEWLKRAGGGN